MRCVYASLDSRAQALYLKFGMRLRGMIYLLRGKPARPLDRANDPGAPERRQHAKKRVASRVVRRTNGHEVACPERCGRTADGLDAREPG